MLLAACTGPWNPRTARPTVVLLPCRRWRRRRLHELQPEDWTRPPECQTSTGNIAGPESWPPERIGRLLLLYLLASKHTHKHSHNAHLHKHSKKTTEAGCQRGTNTYQCWPPLQLSDTIQVHEYIKALKKKKTASIQVNKRPCAEKIYYWQHTGNTQY